MTKDEALKMAIKALQNISKSLTEKQVWFSSDVYDSINACKEALEQPTNFTSLDEVLADMQRKVKQLEIQNALYADDELQLQLDNKKLREALARVIKISDRQHDAWDRAKELLSTTSQGETK